MLVSSAKIVENSTNVKEIIKMTKASAVIAEAQYINTFYTFINL